MKRIFIKLIKKYQSDISSKTKPKCKHYPTCSNYALQAYEKYNVFTATYLSTKRVLSCHPLAKPKYDPLPIKKSEFTILF